MTEQLQSHPEAARPPLEAQEALVMGRTAILEPQTSSRPMEVGGRQLETNLPAGEFFEPYGEDTGTWAPDPIDRPLLPSSLDSLPAGTYFVSGEVNGYDEAFLPTTYQKERHISVVEDENGKRLAAESFTAPWSIGIGAGQLMSELGYAMNGDEVAEVPTPDTLKTKAADLGVDIHYFPDQEHIHGKDYLSVFAAGGYPISTLKESIYKHDSEDDHLTAIVLGGVPLKEILRTAADTALKNPQVIDDTAAGFDTYTATLRAVVSAHPELAGEAYGPEKGRQTLVRLGNEIGVDAEATNAIIATAQQNGQKYGMAVRELV